MQRPSHLITETPSSSASVPKGTTPAATSFTPSSSQVGYYTVFWLKRYSNSLELKLQSISSAERMTVSVEPRTPLWLLVDNDLALAAVTFSIALSFCWFVFKGFMAIIQG